MSETLPKGWVFKNLAGVCTKPQYGWTSSANNNGKIRLLRTTDISNGIIDWEKVPFCLKQPKELEKFLVAENDILVSRAGSVGISYRITKKDLTHPTVFASYLIRFCPYIPASFIEHYLQSHQYWSFISDSQLGIAVPNVNASKLSQLPVPIPPLNEQKRIVAKLDAIMPRIDSVKERLEKVPTILKRFRQSVLTAAVTGKLTEKWREEHPEAEGAKTFKLKELFDSNNSFCYGVIQPGAYVTDGNYLIRVNNISNNGDLDLSDVRKISHQINSKYHRSILRGGELLISIVGAIGRVAIASKKVIGFNVARAVAKIPLDDQVNNKYALYYFLQSHVINELESLAREVARKTLNLKQLQDIEIPLPPLEEQKEVVKQVDKLFAFVDKVETHYQKVKARIDKLSQSVLAKAFRGELISQDANDLPAPRPGKWFVYVLECDDGSYYKGFTKNILERWKQHVKKQSTEWTKNIRR